MLRSVFAVTLWRRRRSFIGWGIGMAVVVAINMAPYPSFKDDPALQSLTESMPEWARAMFGAEDLLSAAGWLDAQFYAFLFPLLFAIFGVARGADAIAGEEGKGTLELVLSAPLARARFLSEKVAALVVAVGVLGAWTLAVLWASVVLTRMDIAFVNVLAATIGSVLLGLLLGALALASGASNGRRGSALAVAGLIGIAGYLIDSLAPLADIAERVRPVSPFYYASRSDPLTSGFATVDVAVLLAAIAAIVGFAAWAFERRDLGT